MLVHVFTHILRNTTIKGKRKVIVSLAEFVRILHIICSVGVRTPHTPFIHLKKLNF